MKKIAILVAGVIFMIICFFTSWLFFMSSGIIDENSGELNEWKAVQILRDLDKIPFVNMGVEDLKFSSHGILTSINNDSLVLLSGKGEQFFDYTRNMPHIKEQDKVKIYYNYSPEGKVIIINIKKILDQKELSDFDTCRDYSVESCPSKCVVCPPCEICSSISCQSEEFCKNIGIDKSWYEQINNSLHSPSISSTVKVSEEEIHCFSWMDSELKQVLLKSNIIDSGKFFLMINQTTCTDISLGNKFISKGTAFGSCGKVGNMWDSFVESCGSFEFKLEINGSLRDTCLILNEKLIFSEVKDGEDLIGDSTCMDDLVKELH